MKGKSHAATVAAAMLAALGGGGVISGGTKRRFKEWVRRAGPRARAERVALPHIVDARKAAAALKRERKANARLAQVARQRDGDKRAARRLP